jgi:apolipoprotein N-acyltransferase
MPAALDALIALLAGWAHAQAFAPREGWALQLLATAVLAWRVMNAPTMGRAALLGWLFGFAWLAGGVWWLFISMHRYGGLPAWLAALAVAALSAALALYLALAMAAFARWRRGRPAADALLFAACWLLAELARGLLFTGFPWVAAGYAHSEGPLAALAPWAGVYGMGVVAAWLAAALAAGLAPGARSWRHRLGAWMPPLILLLAAAAAPSDFTRPTGRFDVTLLQPNVAQDEKFSAEHLPATLEWLGRELVSARTDLVVAPETAIPLLPAQQPEGYWEALSAHFSQGETAALIGLPLGDFTEGYTNSVAGLAPGQPMYRYDKIHLVPFGEFIPFGFRWFVDLMNMPLGDFTRGRETRPFEFDGQRIRPTICYEDLFGEELAANFVGQVQATVIANVSNIGWFGQTEAVDQHLQISRLRALEFQRPLVRATNTGATAIIDHHGRVTAWLAPHTPGVLVGEVEGRDGSTPYARWVAAFGLWPLLGLGLGVVGLSASRRGRGAGA